MKKSLVNNYLGLNVVVKTFDDEYIGVLEKGTGYEEGWYHCKGHQDNYWFRSSHIKTIKRLTLD